MPYYACILFVSHYVLLALLFCRVISEKECFFISGYYKQKTAGYNQRHEEIATVTCV